MEKDNEFWKANSHLVETWSDFVKVNLENGETIDGIRKRLASNNLTQEQIDLILDPNSKILINNALIKQNTKYTLLGIFKLILGLFFLLLGFNMPFALIIGVSGLCLSFMWFSKIKRL